METQKESRSKDLNILLVVLETDKQSLADEIGEDRAVVSKALAGQRKAPNVRRKLAKALCNRVEALVLPGTAMAEPLVKEV